MEFDGSDDTINTTIRNIQANSNGFTVELWAKHTSTGFKFLAGDRDASTSNGEWSFAINNAGSDLSFNTWFGAGPSNDNLQSSSAGINDKNWHHLAATFDAGTGVKRIYVDGAQIATSTTVSGTPGTAGTEVTIGRVTEFPTSFIFAGTLDEVAIYNISLSSEIIAKHSGYGIDKSIYGNNASLMYNVTINQTGCKFGECLVFNNNAFRFVNITDSSSLDVKNMTLSAWIYRKSTGTRDMIVTKTNDGTDGWQLEVDNVDKLSYSNANSPCDTAALLQGSTIISANQWYHVAATIGSDDTNRVYVNGVLDGSASDTTGVCVNNLVVLIGRRIAAGDEQPFDGIIDELSIWNQSLPSDKIAQHAGTKILDYSQYANNGTRSFNSTSDFGRNFTDGKFSKALVFDGVNDFVTVGNKSTYNFLHGALDTANFKFTIETWMKLPNPNTNALYSLISSGPAGSGATGTTFYYEDRDAVRKRSLSLWIVSTGGTICDNTACISNANSYPSDSGWHHVAAVYDSTPASNNANFYIDGVFAGQGSKTANGATGDSTYPLHIGSTGIESFFFPGSLDEVAIWNMTLENDTIKQHALRGFGNLSLQARTCTQSDCSDNPSFGTTYFTNASNIYNLNLSNSRYFQYIAYLSTNSTNLTPVLNNVSINYSLRSNLTIWDDTDTLVRVVTQNVRFYANFTNGVNSINGTNINCSFSHNLSGSFSQETNMSFNSTTGIYFIDQQFSINKTAFF
ncbi:LamG domain-containing protein, partial [Candidatus Woesearchaeota archaeon]|nr:LamG domain-containing protein [Candidatus Woesearchaeota archaeon]